MSHKYYDRLYELDKRNALKTDLSPSARAESANAVSKRMSEALTAIAEKQRKAGGGNVLVVSSALAISLFLETLGEHYSGVGIPNESVTKLVFSHDKFSVEGPVGSMSYYNNGKNQLLDKR
ncbi:histidine phosphatase family protein [Bifidobacterium bohemicum]|uniref:Phosphoglycerate mutase family protein n=1 Tax=Bifidobacterium bohemicum DSM 22767 TaxID=1437606 RepID=A0A086ZHP6_9BIFI|nr:histidine phosphatase family protein [Bifidobacterium bohemicum]KFI46046.1 phosphoglycerate mutase family protein [Bifidobacterium bohemicum DSM 22767]